MKKAILLAVLAVLLLNLQAQETKEAVKPESNFIVPELVKKAFALQYPNATKVEWGIEKPDEYEAEFIGDKTEMSAVFDEKGVLLEAETEIDKSKLPSAVKATLSKDFADYKIGEIEKSESKGAISYEMEAKKEKEEFELSFDNNGKLLKKEAISEDEEND
jgi:hypothetical protein